MMMVPIRMEAVMVSSKQSAKPQQRHRKYEQLNKSEKEVALQIMVPEVIRRQVAVMSAERGESIRTIVLRGLRTMGIDVPESELVDRRARRRIHEGDGNGAK